MSPPDLSTENPSRNPLLLKLSVIAGGLLAGVGLGIFLLVALTQGGLLAGDEPGLEGGSLRSPAVDAPAPDFELERLSGGSLRLSSLQGKPVLVNFWATWCGPCITEMPAIEETYRKYAGQFAVLAVDAGEPAETVAAFVEEQDLTFDVLLDPGSKVQSLYRLRGYPTTFVIDAEGIVRVHHIGPLSENQLADYLMKVGVGE
jgi:thiol-disulfide isomerase/thioredoxin